MSQLIRDLMSSSEVEILPIESRTKTQKSFSKKSTSDDKLGKYEHLEDVTDLSGLRVIAYLQNDCLKACEILRNNFNVDLENSVDKSAEMDEDRFGYASNHFVVSLNDERGRLPEFRKFKGLKAEVQVRTVLQHAWAAIDWKLRYKSSGYNAPREVKRKLYRIAAYLEGADENFSEIYESVTQLRKLYAKKISSGELKLPLNLDSLRTYIEVSKRVTDIWHTFVSAGFTGIGEKEETLSKLLRRLEELGIDGLRGLESLLDGSIDLEIFAPLSFNEAAKDLAGTRVPISKAAAVRVYVLMNRSDDDFERLKRTFLTARSADALSRARALYKEATGMPAE